MLNASKIEKSWTYSTRWNYKCPFRFRTMNNPSLLKKSIPRSWKLGFSQVRWLKINWKNILEIWGCRHFIFSITLLNWFRDIFSLWWWLSRLRVSLKLRTGFLYSLILRISLIIFRLCRTRGGFMNSWKNKSRIWVLNMHCRIRSTAVRGCLCSAARIIWWFSKFSRRSLFLLERLKMWGKCADLRFWIILRILFNVIRVWWIGREIRLILSLRYFNMRIIRLFWSDISRRLTMKINKIATRPPKWTCYQQFSAKWISTWTSKSKTLSPTVSILTLSTCKPCPVRSN